MSGDSGLRPHLTEPPFVFETLAWCNDRRAEDGKPPLGKLPRGKRRAASSCPCGAATGWLVYGDGKAERGDKELNLPEGVRRFVAEFDEGLLPQYTLPALGGSMPSASSGGSSDG